MYLSVAIVYSLTVMGDSVTHNC